MVEITGSYEGQKHCQLVHGPSKTIIHTDAPKDNNGKGEAFSPTDLLAASVGSCVMTIMGIYADNNSIDLTGANFKVLKEMQANPRKVATLSIEVNLPAHLSLKQRKILEKVAETCPVKLSLHPDVKVQTTFNYN